MHAKQASTAATMSVRKTLAQMRAEKDQRQRERDMVEGCRLGLEVNVAFGKIDRTDYDIDLEYETLNELLDKANRSCELLQSKPEAEVYRHVLHIKAELYTGLGKLTLAVDAF